MRLPTQRRASYLCQWRLLCHRINLLSLCSKLNDKLKYKEIIFLKNLLVYLLVTVATFEISLSTTLSTQRWINRIATSHSMIGVLLVSMKIALSSNKAVILVFKALEPVSVNIENPATVSKFSVSSYFAQIKPLVSYFRKYN